MTVSTNQLSGGKKPGGRPRKFAEASRPVTLTLPDSTLHALQHIDPDRGQAIVKLVNRALQNGEKDKPLVEIITTSRGMGIIVVGPSQVAFPDIIRASCRSRTCSLPPCARLRPRFQKLGDCDHRSSRGLDARRSTRARLDHATASTHQASS